MVFFKKIGVERGGGVINRGGRVVELSGKYLSFFVFLGGDVNKLKQVGFFSKFCKKLPPPPTLQLAAGKRWHKIVPAKLWKLLTFFL